MQGIIKWFNNSKGFGFIEVEGREKEVFLHYSAIQVEGYKTVKKDDLVEFEIINGDKGEQASEVKVISQPAEKKESIKQ